MVACGYLRNVLKRCRICITPNHIVLNASGYLKPKDYLPHINNVCSEYTIATSHDRQLSRILRPIRHSAARCLHGADTRCAVQ